MLSYFKLIYNLYQIKKDKTILLSNEFVSKLKKTIDGCGMIVIKMVQATIPIIELRKLLQNDEIFKKIKMDLDDYYSNCNEHYMEHTLNLYNKSFNKSLYDDYHIIDLIGSGSVAQVYKIRNKKTNKIYAMKVVHEYSYSELLYFRILYFIVCKIYKNDILNIEYSDIYENIIKQYSMINEVKNMLLFKHTYESDIIKVPNIIQFSDDIIIMDYIENEDISEESKTNLISILHYNQYYYKLFHGDIHKNNIVYKNDCIYLIDFGCSFIIPDELDIKNTLISLSPDDYINVIKYCISINKKNKNIDLSFIKTFREECIELKDKELKGKELKGKELNNSQTRIHTLFINLFLETLNNNNVYIPYNLLLLLVNSVYYQINTNNKLLPSLYDICTILKEHHKYSEIYEFINNSIKKKIKKRDEDYKHLKSLIKLE
tara:strand:+ start:5228 stop:6520 length:1293 start_codon:yes stop_codon:yes gene_type:complete